MPKPVMLLSASKRLTLSKAPPPPQRSPATGSDDAPVRPRSRRSSPRRWLTEVSSAVLGAVQEAAEALAAPRAGRRFHEFADLVTTTREPEAIEAALVRLAGEFSGACRVELVLDRDVRTNPHPKRIALWPDAASAMTAEQVEALGSPLCLGLWCGDHYLMTLQLHARPGALREGRWSPRVVRRLTTLCAMGAAAERGLYASQRGWVDAPAEASAVVRDATFLNAVLPYALAQAARHREPLTVLCLEVDALASLVRTHGALARDRAVGRVADAVARRLRGSDVVARLDDDRVFALLPSTGGPDALKVAGFVRSAIAAACLPTAGLPPLTVSIGVACYPIDAREMLALLHAADEAMERARACGLNQIATTAPPPGERANGRRGNSSADVADEDDEDDERRSESGSPV